MKVLHVFDHSLPIQSGYSLRSWHILKEQRRVGLETVQVTSPKQGSSGDGSDEVEGVRFYRSAGRATPLSRVPGGDQVDVIAALRRRLTDVVQAERPDVVHAHSPALTGAAAWPVARSFKLPLVYECRAFWEDAAVVHGTCRAWGLRYRLTRALETRVFRRADAVCCICEGLRNEIVGRGIAREKITVVPNAVDATRPRPPVQEGREFRLEEVGLAGASTVVGFVGSFYDYEGLDVLVRAVPLLLSKAPNVGFLLIGGGPCLERIRGQVRAARMGQYIKVIGNVAYDAVPDYYGIMDILVYPRKSSRLTNLVTPLKPLEAMAHGKIVALSDVGGHVELVPNGVAGELFAPDDEEELAGTILRLLDAREAWPQRREAAVSFVKACRSWEQSVARYLPVYDRLCR